MEFVRKFLSQYFVYCVEVLVIIAIIAFVLYISSALNLFKKD